jgi:hypothetical protein
MAAFWNPTGCRVRRELGELRADGATSSLNRTSRSADHGAGGLELGRVRPRSSDSSASLVGQPFCE